MAVRKAIGLIGNLLPSGNRTTNPLALSPGSNPLVTPPHVPSGLTMGTLGWMRLQYSGGSGTPFVANRIITGGTSGTKARVLYEVQPAGVVSNAIVVELITSGGVFRAGETITDDSTSPKSATLAYAVIGNHQSIFEFPQRDSLYPRTLLTELFSPVLNAYTPPNAQASFPWWDRSAKLGALMPVVDSTQVPRWSQIVGQTSGALALVLTSTANQLRLAIHSGTFNASELLDIVGGATGVTSTNGATTLTTAGEWVPYHVAPNLNGIGAGWEEPPGGSDTCGHRGALGFEPYMMARAYSTWGTDLRAIKIDSTQVNGSHGGVCVGVIPCAGTFPGTWTIGEEVTSAGSPGWSATVATFDTVSKFLYLKDVTGGELAPGTVTGTSSGSTATASDNVFGWMPGAKHWGTLLADIAAGLAKQGGDTFDWKWLVLATSDGDIRYPGSAYTGADMQRAFALFSQAIRDELNAPNLVLSWLLPHAGMRPSLSGHAQLVRDSMVAHVRNDPKSRYFTGDGFELAVTTLGQITADTEPVTWETSAFPQLGLRAWNSYLQTTLTSVDQNLRQASLVTITGQSQLAFNHYSALVADGDPELVKLPDMDPGTIPGYPGLTWSLNTLNPDIWIWNEWTKAWEVLDVSVNAAGWGNTLFGYFGPNVSLLPRLQGRLGRIYCLYMPYSASSLDGANKQAPAAWDPDGYTRQAVTASMTVTASNRRITATAGAFSELEFPVGSWVQITGSATWLGFGGNNTLPGRATPVTAVASDGSYIEVGDALVNEGPLSLTVTAGPVDARLLAEATQREAISALVNVQKRIPRHVLHVMWQGEGDVAQPENYAAKAAGHVAWARDIFGWRAAGESPTPVCWLKLTSKTPLGTDEQVATVRAGTDALAELINVVVVNTDDLALRLGSEYPRTERNNYGIHHTAQAVVRAGFRIDAVIDANPGWGIPAHPNGPALVDDFGDTGGVGSGSDVDDIGLDATFVVEDGTRPEGAVSYCTVEFADAWHENYGDPTAWSGATTLAKENALREATQQIDALFGEAWAGDRFTSEQELDWPRINAVDAAGNDIAEDTIPKVVQRVTAAGALLRLQGIDIVPAYTESADVDSETKTVGPISKSVSFRGGKPAHPRLVMIRRMLSSARLIDGGGAWGWGSA